LSRQENRAWACSPSSISFDKSALDEHRNHLHLLLTYRLYSVPVRTARWPQPDVSLCVAWFSEEPVRLPCPVLQILKCATELTNISNIVCITPSLKPVTSQWRWFWLPNTQFVMTLLTIQSFSHQSQPLFFNVKIPL
jgi:hypothetical protein